MKKEWLVKTIALGIVVLFIGTGATSAFYINLIDNNPPNEPNNPHPTNGSIKVPINVVLYWTGGDLDPGDIITYDVYFGDSLPINNLVSNNISESYFELTELELNKTYFWKIVAWDNNGASTSGPNWSFTTGINLPPTAPIIHGPRGRSKAKNLLFAKPFPKPLPKPGTYNYTFNATDPENEYIYYFIDWGDGTNTGWIGPFPSGKEITCNHTWMEKGTYLVKAKAKDIYDQEGPWGHEDIPIKHKSKFVINFQFIKLLKQLSSLHCDCEKNKSLLWYPPIFCGFLLWLAIGSAIAPWFPFPEEIVVPIVYILGRLLHCPF